MSLQIFAKADILLLLQTVRAAYVIIGCHAEKRVGACLVRGQISFIGLNTIVRIFAIFIIPFFCGESKQDRIKIKPHPCCQTDIGCGYYVDNNFVVAL